MSSNRDYVLQLSFCNGSQERIKYEDFKEPEGIFDELKEAKKAALTGEIKDGKTMCELALPDGTRFAFDIRDVVHIKYFRYTKSDYQDKRCPPNYRT